MSVPPVLPSVLGAPPPQAVEVFGPALAQVTAYAQLLAGPGVERGLLGPREAPRLWERHLLNCAGVAELLGEGEVVADVGSGAGLPGIVLALLRPDVTVLLVEPLLRRSTFLEQVVHELGLRTAVVRRARAEELAGSVLVDTVVARAVAPLDRLVGWSLPLLRPGGRLLALKGERADGELAACGAALRAAGASGGEVVTVGQPDLLTDGRVVVVTRGQAAAPHRAPAGRAGRRGRR